MFGMKKKEFSQEQLDKIELCGEKVGRFLFRVNPTRRVNDLILRHRFVVLPAIVVMAFGVMVAGLAFGNSKYYASDIKTDVVSHTESDYPEKVLNLYDEVSEDYQLRVDSVRKLLRQETLTKQESIYVANSVSYFKNLNEQL